MGVHHDGSYWFALCWWYFLFGHYFSARLPIQTSKGIQPILLFFNFDITANFIICSFNYIILINSYVFVISRWCIAHASITATSIPQVKFASTSLKTIGLLP